ncbi:uncharacterized protein LOC141713867 [Apium graveolens]|uniref:uncharacterized protein LOC141713867 n=1 Tax=Apium graveolens TaxID=4045 RepID=UPI003D79AACF
MPIQQTNLGQGLEIKSPNKTLISSFSTNTRCNIPTIRPRQSPPPHLPDFYHLRSHFRRSRSYTYPNRVLFIGKIDVISGAPTAKLIQILCSMMAVLEPTPLREELRYPDVQVLLTVKEHRQISFISAPPKPTV